MTNNNYLHNFIISDEFDDDEEYDFEGNLLNYDSQLDEEMSRINESIRKQQNEHLISQIEPISTESRLERFPEMRRLAVKSKKDLEEIREKKRQRIAKQPGTVAKILKVTPPRAPQSVVTVGDLMKDKEMRKEAENPLQVVICTICGNVFGSKFILQRHVKRHSDGGEVPPPSFICPIQGCSMRCDGQSTLNEHVRLHHSRSDVVYKTYTFTNTQDFENWKEDLEESSNSRFVHSYARVSRCGKSARYSCFFSSVKARAASGEKERGKPPKIRERPSKKLESTCTAHLNVREVFGTVTVKACLVHCGHSMTRRVPLSAVIRKEIAAALMEGLDENTIVTNFKEMSSPDDRRHHLQNYEVRNVLNKLMKNGFQPGGGGKTAASTENLNLLRNVKEEAKNEVEILEAPPFVTEEEVA